MLSISLLLVVALVEVAPLLVVAPVDTDQASTDNNRAG
jgi:hypothetical protein